MNPRARALLTSLLLSLPSLASLTSHAAVTLTTALPSTNTVRRTNLIMFVIQPSGVNMTRLVSASNLFANLLPGPISGFYYNSNGVPCATDDITWTNGLFTFGRANTPNPLTYNPTSGVLDLGGGETIISPAKIALALGSGGNGIWITNTDTMLVTFGVSGLGDITARHITMSGGKTNTGNDLANLFLTPSNTLYQYSTTFIATNGSANTNLTLDFNKETATWYVTNNMSVTNFSNLGEGEHRPLFTRRIIPTLINRTIVYPAFAANTLGVYNRTNKNNTMWTTLTNGVEYILSIDQRGTNLYWAISEW